MAEFNWLRDRQSQGGIEDGEEPKSAAVRELREETGIVSAEIIAEVCRGKISILMFHFSVHLVSTRVWFLHSCNLYMYPCSNDFLSFILSISEFYKKKF